MSVTTSSDWIEVGKIGRPHGIRGEVRCWMHNPESETLYPDLTVRLQLHQDGGGGAPIETTMIETKIARCRLGAKFWIVSFEGIDRREDVEFYRHAKLLVRAEDLPELEPGEFYQADLVGCKVFIAAEEGMPDKPEGQSFSVGEGDWEAFGEVEGFFDTGAHDIMVVRRGGGEYFVPMVRDAVLELDIDSRQIYLSHPSLWSGEVDLGSSSDATSGPRSES